MRILNFLFLANFISAEIAIEGNVLVLTDETFQEAITTYDKILVEFYAPWCGHCKTLEPEWKKAAATLADSPMKLAKVDATENKALAEQFGIKGFPTIKYFNNGSPVDYTGGRVEKEIVSWANKKTGPSVKTISTSEELIQLQEKHESFAIGVFTALDSINAMSFLKLGDAIEGVGLYMSSAEPIKSSLGIVSDAIVVLKTFDDKRADLTIGESFENQVVLDFIMAESVPMIQEFTRESAQQIFKSAITKHTLVFTEKSSAHHEPTLAVLREVAPHIKGKSLIVNVPNLPENKKVYEYFAIESSSLPVVVLADMSEGGIKKYPFSGSIETSSLRSFFSDFFSGKLQPYLKSEEPAPEDTAGGVVVVKGKSFNDLVINNNKDILLEFYAPWCGHCKQLAPKLEELAEKVAKHENIVIAKMDSTANEIDYPGIQVSGFPTIYFLKGGDKKNPKKYEGGRNVADFIEFLEENASTESSVPHEEL